MDEGIQTYEDLIELNTSVENGSKYWTEKDIEEQVIIFDKSVDIYAAVTLRSTPFYFSERLKERLERENISGITIYNETDEDLEFYLG